MPVARMRMRPWLEKMIESNAIPGLTWVDKDNKIFSIPWKHAARHGWEMDKDACLFKEWAIHTGKYTTGQICDPKTWKANFRCAMNSLPDIKEVKDKSVNKGHQAMRVFRMLPPSLKSSEKCSKRKLTNKVQTREDMDDSDSQSPADQSPRPSDVCSTQENTVDSTVNTELPELACMVSDVPDWSLTIEIGSDSLKNISHRFEVSPDHDPTYNYNYDDILEICEQLEKDTNWDSGISDSWGFLNNEACTSPGSHWSELSSVEDLDEQPQYTTLGSHIISPTDNLWDTFCSI
ncbi:interferon regulatory factor 1b [Aulostomus maculatus]